jgi:hypothetical protein
VERAQYEADLARRRYMQVDPDNRLVADTLEAEWNDKLRAIVEAQELYERQSKADRIKMDERRREQILALANDFPRLWNDPHIPPRERKRMIRLLIEDVTLIRNQEITVHIRFKSGQTETLRLPLPESAVTLFKTKPEVIAEVDRLLDRHTDKKIAELLNNRGFRTGRGHPFKANTVGWIRNTYGLKSLYERLREKGLFTQNEIALQFKVTPTTVRNWRDRGFLIAYVYNNKKQSLYEFSHDESVKKRFDQRISER